MYVIALARVRTLIAHATVQHAADDFTKTNLSSFKISQQNETL